MKLFVVLFAIAALTAAHPDNRVKRELSTDEDIDQFQKDIGEYINDPEKEQEAADELAKEEAEIEKANEDFANGDATFDEQVNELSDLSSAEVAEQKEGLLIPEGVKRSFGLIPTPEDKKIISPENRAILDEVYATYNRGNLPASYSSMDSGIVTPARNQKNCGSCAAFAATASHETCLRKAGTPAKGLDLSEQQAVDCGYDGKGANGCDGAYISIYTEYMANKAGGVLNHEADYPYLDRQPNLKCQKKKEWNAGAKITKAISDYGCTEDKMMALVYKYGSAVTAINAGDTSFGNYKSGVFQGCKSKSQNHAVTVVGWGTENGVDYWLVKNSWGASWGNKGFIKMKRGNNECGIGTECSVAECSASGTASPAPIVPPAPPVPASQQCDISTLYGDKGITGENIKLRTWMHDGSQWKEYVSTVKCKSSVCSPQHAGPSNACLYICGKLKC